MRAKKNCKPTSPSPTVNQRKRKKDYMDYSNLKEVSVENTKKVFPEIKHIGNDLALIEDVSKFRYPNELRRVKSLCLGLFTKGTAEYTLDTIEYKVRAGDIIIINNGQMTDNFIQSDDCEGIGLQISDEFYYEIFSGVHELSMLFTFSRTHPVFHLNEKQQQNIITYFNIIKDKVAQTGHHFRRDIVRALIQALIYDTTEAMVMLMNNATGKNSRAETIYVNFMRMVEENFQQERRVGWYAKALHITPKYLSETIKQVSRRTPNDWIDDYVVLEIRNRLKNSSASIKEIAEQMNFPNQSFLGKYFKEHVGMSPSEYRRS